MPPNANFIVKIIVSYAALTTFLYDVIAKPVANSTAALDLFMEICPLGEPLRFRNGNFMRCDCPPNDFCPKLYYCKTVIHGLPGICCPDFDFVGSERREKIRPSETRLSHHGHNHDKKSEPLPAVTPSPTTNPTAQTTTKNSTTPPTTTNQVTKSKKQNCKPIDLKEIPSLPSANCKYSNFETDKAGCPLPPKILCPKNTKGLDCPTVKTPVVRPGCKLGSQKLDQKGCLIAPEVFCESTTVGIVSPSKVPEPPGSQTTVATPVSILPMDGIGFMSHFKPNVKPPNLVPNSPATKAPSAPEVTIPPTNTENTTPGTSPPSPPPCPEFPVPTTPPDCFVGPVKKDFRGCALPPEIICEKRPTTYAIKVVQEKPVESSSNSKFTLDTKSDDPMKDGRSECTEIPTPLVQPGCSLLPTKYDSNGCMLPPEITCDPTVLSKRCPVVTMPKMDPMCSFGLDRNDSNGCPMAPEVICPTTMEPEPTTRCPYIAPPYLPPGCNYGMAKYDSSGCALAPDVVCGKNTLEELNFMPVPVPPRREFKDMLTPDYYHIVRKLEPPEPNIFRTTSAIPVATAGVFHACRVHADCFHFREPREWCQTSSPESNSVWTEKSCHCADDTYVPACIVERMNRGHREWTFCADFSQCARKK